MVTTFFIIIFLHSETRARSSRYERPNRILSTPRQHSTTQCLKYIPVIIQYNTIQPNRNQPKPTQSRQADIDSIARVITKPIGIKQLLMVTEMARTDEDTVSCERFLECLYTSGYSVSSAPQG